MHDEAKWASDIASGERAAFGRFVDAFGPRVHRLARRFAADECDAEDLTQEIFVSLFQSAGTFQARSSLSTWVYRVAMNHCLRHREKAARQPAASTCSSNTPPVEEASSEVAEVEAADGEADPARQAARREMRQQVRLSLEELSESHRAIVILHELHGLTYGECAQALGIPLGTVKSRLFNALRHLRRHLAPYVLGSDAEEAPASPPLASKTSPRTSTSTSTPSACGEASQ